MLASVELDHGNLKMKDTVNEESPFFSFFWKVEVEMFHVPSSMPMIAKRENHRKRRIQAK